MDYLKGKFLRIVTCSRIHVSIIWSWCTIVINKVKVMVLRYAVTEQKSNLTVPEILDPSLTINDVLKEIRSVEALDFVHKMSSYNHIAYLYSNKVSLSKILSEYFSPRDAPKALLTEKPNVHVLFDHFRLYFIQRIIWSHHCPHKRTYDCQDARVDRWNTCNQ